MDERSAYLWLGAVIEATPREVRALTQWPAWSEDLSSFSAQEFRAIGWAAPRADEAVSSLLAYDPQEVLRQAERQQARLLTPADDDYPTLLAHIYDPPPVLWIRGRWPNKDAVAFVGSRQASSYGRNAAQHLAATLAPYEVVVVSGLARGIDSAAHRGALQGGIPTVAVLGSGLAHLYPKENMALAEEIVTHNGALLTEYPPAAPPLAYHFPRRNRIIAGLSKGVIVVEAGMKSGALITADFAVSEGREVGAVPGSIFSQQSQGTLALVHQGAALIRHAEDIAALLGLQRCTLATGAVELAEGTSDTSESVLLEQIGEEPVSIDGLVRRNGASTAALLATLTQLELEGRIERLPGGRVVRHPII
ncbi:MAG: DNA-protecting protein DprA [Firmicutes bacterium]|nr:DNA-protecting protein DprA [Bacillota bacterium]